MPAVQSFFKHRRAYWAFQTCRLIAVAGLIVLTAMATAHARSHGAKRSSVKEIVVHATGGPFCQGGQVKFSPPGTVATIKKFFEGNGTVSIHYIVGKDGEVAASVPEDEVAIHTIGHNDASIGIEMINFGDGQDVYPDAQVAAIAKLIAGIRARHNLPMESIKRHADLDHSTIPCGGQSVRRKQDPGANFPWDKFREQVVAFGEPARVTRPPTGLAARAR